MRYLFVTTGNLERNASFVRLRELGRGLATLGADVTYVVDDTPYNSELAQTLTFATVNVLIASQRVSQVFERRRAILRAEPDVVHVLNPQPYNSSAVFGAKRPVVVDWDELLSQRFSSPRRRFASRLCEAYGRRKASLTVVASRYQQTFFRERFQADALYLPYACYLPEMTDGPNPYPKPTAVYLGNFHPDFDHDLLLDAWQLLASNGAAPHLELIGSGEDLEKVRRIVIDRGLSDCVSVPGYMSGGPLWDRLRHAHVLLFPIRDTIGNRMRCPSKTFAYMQAERSIITNRVGEVAEALGDLASYVPPTAQGFASAVSQAFRAPPAAVEYDLARHTWLARATVLMDAVTPILASPPVGACRG